MTDEMRALVQAVAEAFSFRRRGPFEAEGQYRDALLAYVEDRDFSTAHELRIGRRQADWTPDDAAQFTQRLMSIPGPRQEVSGTMPVNLAIVGGLTPERAEPTDTALLDLAERGLRMMMTRCQTVRYDPASALIPIFVTLLLDDGRVLVTSVDRGDRVAILKGLARTYAVFGFTLIFDAFIHVINETTGTAAKREALLCQIGTKTMRWTKFRPYQIVNHYPVFTQPTPPDLDVRDITSDDPYATVFVSVPESKASH